MIRVTLRSGGQGVTIFYGGETTNAPGLAEVRLGWPPSSEALYRSLRPLLRTDMILTELIGKTSVGSGQDWQRCLVHHNVGLRLLSSGHILGVRSSENAHLQKKMLIWKT